MKVIWMDQRIVTSDGTMTELDYVSQGQAVVVEYFKAADSTD